MLKIKVCHFSSVHSITDTRVFYRECRSLAKVYDVTLIGIGDFTGLKDGVYIKGIVKPANKFIRYFYTIFKTFSEAVKTDAALYHIHDAEMIPFGIILSLAGKKVIYDIHENTSADILLKPWIPIWLRKFLSGSYNALLKLGSNFMHFIIVIADPLFLKDFYVKNKQCTIIQNFANTEDLYKFVVNKRSNLSGNHLFYIGMIKDMYYDINTLFEAMYQLKLRGLLVHLHCIGYFGEATNAQLCTYPHWDEIKEQVIFYGFMKMENAFEISKLCKIGICLKNQPESMLVSHERKLFEYMAIGLPSVFCDSHIYSALNQKCMIGIAVDLTNPVAIAGAIEKLLGSENLLDKLTEANLFWAQTTYNWKAEETTLLLLYKNLLNNPL
ncbi:MAG: glycosyltransferase [Bacteroidia bacterium]|nr:glycosyltransferase [Bacteroidia bacterium]